LYLVADQDFDLTTDLVLRVNRAYEETSSHLLYVLNHKYKLKNHLFTLRKFFLLGQGDFARHLLDGLRSDLNKPAKNLSRHDLQGAFGCAVQNFNLQSEADHLLLLDFRILQHNKGDLGWNVFTLDCHAQPPLSTIITPQVKNVYMQVFMFLWRSKRVEHNLIEVWKKSMEFTRRLSALTELKGFLQNFEKYFQIVFLPNTTSFVWFAATFKSTELIVYRCTSSMSFFNC